VARRLVPVDRAGCAADQTAALVDTENAALQADLLKYRKNPFPDGCRGDDDAQIGDFAQHILQNHIVGLFGKSVFGVVAQFVAQHGEGRTGIQQKLGGDT